MRISLDKLVFFGYHGLYAEEKKLGNTYIVDVINISQPSNEAIIAIIDDYKGFVEELTSTKINQVISDEVINNANVNFNNNISFTNE
mgnify:CR=1 FL=1